jgi:two-component system nitrogen regulation sensor histidine kinase NtrY
MGQLSHSVDFAPQWFDWDYIMAVTTAGASISESLRQTVWSGIRSPYLAMGVGIVAVAVAVVTYMTIAGEFAVAPTPGIVLSLIIVNFLLVMVLAALIALRLADIWNQRHSGLKGSRLHGRLVGIFSAIAIIPAVLTAAVAAFTINLGMEAWFSKGVRTALDNSLAVASGYLEEHKRNIRADVLALGSELNRRAFLAVSDPASFKKVLFDQAGVRALDGAAIYDGQGALLESAIPGFVVSLDRPSEQDFETARRGEVSLETDPDGSQVRALIKLEVFADSYLMAVRNVDAKVVGYLQDTQRVVGEYKRLDQSRTGVQITFGLIYASVALVLLIASVFAGMWAANRIVSPISRLVGAAERVSRGDLTARVPLDRSDDEVATLSLAFNRMTGELESQRNELIESHRQTEARRRFTEAVLSGVSAGVIGLDAGRRVNIMNRSAQTMLDLGRDPVIGQPLAFAATELDALVQAAIDRPDGRAQGQIDVVREGTTKNLTVRVTSEIPTEGERGYVVTFDDVTDLITAQRSSAWADVARRIAHEIKNPLTPIQLSAERLRRKYKKEIVSDPEVFEQCTQTIIRQVSDIGRMVDEFSSFARMPQPVMRVEDMSEIVRHSVFLQRVALPQIKFDLVLPDGLAPVVCDGRLVSQALTNVLKNAGEAVKAKFAIAAAQPGGDENYSEGGRIEIRFLQSNDTSSIEIADNGIGLPLEDRHRLTEPYVTKRAKGTGLGLAIVRKIMEDHSGHLTLDDAPKLDATGAERATGARVRLSFPRSLKPASASEQTISQGTGSDDEQKRAAHSL